MPSGGLLEQLVQALGGKRSAVGVELAGELEDGELVAEVTVRIRRRIVEGDRAAWLKLVETSLVEIPRLARFCRHVTEKRVRGETYKATCKNRPVAAAIMAPAALGPAVAVFLVCQTHRHTPGFDRGSLLGVIDIPPAWLSAARVEADRVDSLWWREEQARIDAERELARGGPS